MSASERVRASCSRWSDASLHRQVLRRLRDSVSPRDAKLPLEALRDLLAIVRALFTAWTRAKVGPIELEELAHIGRELRKALGLARMTEPGTRGHRAAWSRAEEAALLLAHLVVKLEPLHLVLESAAQRPFPDLDPLFHIVPGIVPKRGPQSRNGNPWGAAVSSVRRGGLEPP